MTLSVSNLTGGYLGQPVLKNVSFEVEKGQLAAFVGLNGSGKSTTIKEIMGLLQPFSGQIMVDGLSLDQNSGNYRKKIGYIPESPLLYEELTLKEHLELTALAYDLDKKEALQKSIDLLKLFRLEDKLDWFPTTFSKGMQQKVMIICAFLVQPALYIIDEPFMGLDPLAINDLIALMNQAKAGGAAILMSTHILSNAEKFCDKFIVLKDGEVAADGNMEDLRRQFDTENKRASSLEEIYLKLTSNLTAGEARHARTF